MCCFDKTGTLTSDDLRVRGVAKILDLEGRTDISAAKDANYYSPSGGNVVAYVLGACHQPVMLTLYLSDLLTHRYLSDHLLTLSLSDSVVTLAHQISLSSS